MRKSLSVIQDEYTKTVKKHNDLIQKSRFQLNVNEQKLILSLISKINYTDDDFKSYSFSLYEFCKLLNVSQGGNNYAELKKNIENITDKKIWLPLPDGKEALCRWVEMPLLEGNKVTVKINPYLKPYLLQLKSNYTQYDLIYVLGMKHKYSIRLYEWVKSVHFQELEKYTTNIISVDFLKDILGVEGKSYEEYRFFKNRILKKAIEEINLMTDKLINVVEVKDGRRISGLIFEIETKSPTQRIKVRSELEKKLGVGKQLSLFDLIEE